MTETESVCSSDSGSDGSEDRKDLVSLIEEAEKQAMDCLNISDAQSRRDASHGVRLAETFIEVSDSKAYSKAEQRCELALMRDPLHVKAALYLSHALEARNRMKQTLDELMKIRHIIQSSDFKASDLHTWEYELERFWNLCGRTNSAKEAFIACRDLAEAFPGEKLPHDKAWEWIMKDKKLDGNVQPLSDKRENGHSLLAVLFGDNARSEEFHQRFYSAPKEYQHLLSQTYEDAISAANLSMLDKVYLQYYYGISLFHQGKSSEAFNQWELSVDELKDPQRWDNDPQLMFDIFSLVVGRLGSGYLEALMVEKRSKATIDG